MQFAKSLKTRILLPIGISAAAVSALLAAGSWKLGRDRAYAELSGRLAKIEGTVDRATYPLSPNVLETLAELTESQWVTLSNDDSIIHSTLRTDDKAELSRKLLALDSFSESPSTHADSFETLSQSRVTLANESYYAFFRTLPPIGTSRTATTVCILFEEKKIREQISQATIPPLVTGLLTTFTVALISYLFAIRFITRIGRLKHQVEKIAGGEFKTKTDDTSKDELGQLAEAVNVMGRQLDELWSRIGSQQREKLLHQLAGGMAHQLRNTLTGARMAVELHQDSGASADASSQSEDLQVALQQIEKAESYVSRILMLGTGRASQPVPLPIGQILEDLRTVHAPVAKHLGIDLGWSTESLDLNIEIRNSGALSAAVQNLVWNALQVGEDVQVHSIQLPTGEIQIEVIDDGPGISQEVADSIFEPFTTTKREGVGLGLPMVKRCIAELGGTVAWQRQENKTRFQLVIPNSNVISQLSETQTLEPQHRTNPSL